MQEELYTKENEVITHGETMEKEADRQVTQQEELEEMDRRLEDLTQRYGEEKKEAHRQYADMSEKIRQLEVTVERLQSEGSQMLLQTQQEVQAITVKHKEMTHQMEQRRVLAGNEFYRCLEEILDVQTVVELGVGALRDEVTKDREHDAQLISTIKRRSDTEGSGRGPP